MEQFIGQKNIKYAAVNVARGIAVPATRTILDEMLDGSTTALVDIKYWPMLEVGDIPGVPGWHYDVWNDPIKGKLDIHKLFILGAGCRTEFKDKMIDEGKIFKYTGADAHRITPVTLRGPRILIRCSWTTLKPQNVRQNIGTYNGKN